MDSKRLLNSQIKWKRSAFNEKYFQAEVNGELLILRLNNFPEEPLLTLINGQEILDVEERPLNWQFEEAC